MTGVETTLAEGGNTRNAEGRMKSMVEKAKASPFYLHPSDGPGNLITLVQLKGENYED